MSNSLPLLLERVISASRLSSALELLLDRKLGDLSRYTYVYADALPLRLERKISEQPAPNALYMALSQPLGTLAPVLYVTSNALPLPLSVLISEQPSSNALPLGLTRKLGTIFGAPVDPEEPVDPEPEPPEYAPAMPNASACFAVSYSGAYGVSRDYSVNKTGLLIAQDYDASYTHTVTIAQSFKTLIKHFDLIGSCRQILTGLTYQLASCKKHESLASLLLLHKASVVVSASVGYSTCIKAYSTKVAHYQRCDAPKVQHALNYATDSSHSVSGRAYSHCQVAKVSEAIPVPDRYYPIPEPPPVRPDSVCHIRPPSSELPLRMARKRNGLLSSHLPLSLTCWHDDPPVFIPNLRSYIVHNVITATIGGISVDLLSFSIKTDMDSYCWQGNIDITPTDYAKIKAKLDVPRGSEPMINVVINGFVFSFIAEEQSRSRQFANHTHSLSGRSITARLGADYAVSQGGLIDQASYVSQIVAQQLNGLSISLLDWDINDWLVPASAYSVANKTPIAVISDIAAAGGGFVISDPSQATLSVKPRWRVPAWDLASSTPDVTVPMDVIQQISDQKRANPRYNTVLLTSASEGGEVYRQLQARDADAPTQAHALYTDRDAIKPAGTALLSDSGIHGDYDIKMLWADEYNVALAKLGDIWQINDPEGAWRGVVKSVTIRVGLDNNAPAVWQTVTVDRYLDA